jgi:lipid A 3-O-deacylase
MRIDSDYLSTKTIQCAVLALFAAFPAILLQAQDVPRDATAIPSDSAAIPNARPWDNQGRWNFGAQLGYAIEYGLARHEISHIELLLAQPQLGLILRDSRSPHFPVQRVELITEGVLGGAIHPGAYMAGVTLLFRFDGKNHGRWVPFFDGGAGVQRTSLSQHVPELNGTTEFSPQGGFGLQYFFRPQRALVFEFRTMHMSNADITPPNMGFNSGMISIGFRWLRRPVRSGDSMIPRSGQ